MTTLTWPEAFLPGEWIPYHGRSWRLSVKYDVYHDAVAQNDSLRITLPAQTLITHYPQQLQINILSWLKTQALSMVELHIQHYGAKMGRMPRRFGVKLTKSRWGSLGIHDDLYINWLLILAPKSVLEYVVVHEMSHLFYRSHGPRFWGVVKKWCPEYQAAEKWLRDEGAKQLLGWYARVKSINK